jgi:hypothetical protein
MTARYVTAKVAQGVASRLDARDLAVLRSTQELRFISGDQLTRMHFDGQTRAARRILLRLTNLGVLERLPRRVGGVRAGSAGFVYRLGASGQRVALDKGWLPKRKRRSAVPGSLFIGHALRVAELHVRLVEADRDGEIELLELQAEPACHRRYGQRAILKPDSCVRLGSGDFEDSYFIEVDMGTEGSRALHRQLRAYVAYYGSGREQAERGVFPKVLWLAPDAKRVSAIEACVRQLPVGDRELFAAAEFDQAIVALAGAAANR